MPVSDKERQCMDVLFAYVGMSITEKGNTLDTKGKHQTMVNKVQGGLDTLFEKGWLPGPLQHIKKEDLWEKVKTVTGKAMYVRWQALKRHMQNHMGHVWKVFWRYYDQGENPL